MPGLIQMSAIVKVDDKMIVIFVNLIYIYIYI